MKYDINKSARRNEGTIHINCRKISNGNQFISKEQTFIELKKHG